MGRGCFQELWLSLMAPPWRLLGVTQLDVPCVTLFRREALIYMYMYVYPQYIVIYVQCIYMYVAMYMIHSIIIVIHVQCIYVAMYMYVYLQYERERERGKKWEGGREGGRERERNSYLQILYRGIFPVGKQTAIAQCYVAVNGCSYNTYYMYVTRSGKCQHFCKFYQNWVTSLLSMSIYNCTVSELQHFVMQPLILPILKAVKLRCAHISKCWIFTDPVTYMYIRIYKINVCLWTRNTCQTRNT